MRSGVLFSDYQQSGIPLSAAPRPVSATTIRGDAALKTSLLLAALRLSAGTPARAAVSQWVAFNDHYRGPNTGPNVSAWAIFTTGGGNPEETGALLDDGLTVWTPVAASPGSPYTVTPSGSHRFFRVR